LTSKYQGKYLVKWRVLPYSDCTWETAADIQNDKLLQRFHIFEQLPSEATAAGTAAGRALSNKSAPSKKRGQDGGNRPPIGEYEKLKVPYSPYTVLQ
jgi:hypothetical protein